MWQRFTERARKVVFYAQEEAQKYGEGYVSTEHLLLGLIREDDNTACRVLLRLGISLGRIRAEVERQMPRADARPSHDMSLTPRAKRVIDLAYDEARHIGNSHIGTEHLLVGLIRADGGVAGKVLVKLGVDLDVCRELVVVEQQPERVGWGKRTTTVDPDIRAKAEQAARLRALLGTFPVSSRDHIFSRLLAMRKRIGLPEMLALIALAEAEPPLEDLLRDKGLEPLIIIGAIEGTILRELGSLDETAGPSVATTLQTAQGLADGKPLNSAHLVLALLELGDNGVAEVFTAAGITAQDLRSVL